MSAIEEDSCTVIGGFDLATTGCKECANEPSWLVAGGDILCEGGLEMRLDGYEELRCGVLGEAVDEAEVSCKMLTLNPATPE